VRAPPDIEESEFVPNAEPEPADGEVLEEPLEPDAGGGECVAP
jgi:hypothetical protein